MGEDSYSQVGYYQRISVLALSRRHLHQAR